MGNLIESYEELLLIEIERAKKEGAQPEKLNAFREAINDLLNLELAGALGKPRLLTAREVIEAELQTRKP